MIRKAAAILLTVFSLPAAAVSTLFDAQLTGAKEAPPNASPGFGFSVVMYDNTLHTLRVQALFAGLVAPTTAAHIHCCVSSPGAAGVATTTPTFAGFPLGVTTGIYDRTLDLTSPSSWNPAFIAAAGGTTAGAEAVLAAGLFLGTSYFNIHTTAFPGGEIRGFLAVPIPEPSAYALFAAGLLVVAYIVRRRQHRR